MKKFNIEVNGRSESDILNALEEIKSRIENEFIEGADSNTSGSYKFNSSGGYGEYCVTNHVKETVFLTTDELVEIWELYCDQSGCLVELESLKEDETADDHPLRQEVFQFAEDNGYNLD